MKPITGCSGSDMKNYRSMSLHGKYEILDPSEILDPDHWIQNLKIV